MVPDRAAQFYVAVRERRGVAERTGAGDGEVGLLDAVAIEVGLVVGGALFALVGVGVHLAGAGVYEPVF